jgi:hypothetical protein
MPSRKRPKVINKEFEGIRSVGDNMIMIDALLGGQEWPRAFRFFPPYR